MVHGAVLDVMMGSYKGKGTEKHAAGFHEREECDETEAFFRLLMECFGDRAGGYDYPGGSPGSGKSRCLIPANGIEGISRHPRRPRKTLLNQVPRGALHVARKLLRPGMRTAPATAHAGHCD